MMRAPELLAKKNIDLRVGAGATAIDRAAKQVALSDGSTLDYDGLALCTGSRLRQLPLADEDWQGVHGLRSLDDPAIAAAGDCTVRRMEDGSLRRLESVQNALWQGKSAATALLGRERPFNAAPLTPVQRRKSSPPTTTRTAS